MTDASESAPLDAVLQDASELADAGEWAEAFRLLREEEDEHAEHPTLLCMLGAAARELGHEGPAYDYFRRCVATDTEDPLLLVTAGTALANFDDPEAERVLRLAATLAPGMLVARLHYGSYLAREGLFDDALRELEAARAIEPAAPAVHAELGVAYLLSGRLAEGADALTEALSEREADVEPGLHALHGLALVQLDRPGEAAEALYRAADAEPDDSDLQLAAALACAAEGWETEAWNLLARAEGSPDPPAASLLREAEDAIESEPDDARRLLLDELAPSLLRERLFARG